MKKIPVLSDIVANSGVSGATWTELLFEFIRLSFARFAEIVMAPFQATDMLWILTPMIINMLLMEFYFGRYESEELGWNTAFGNSLVLIFVSVDLLRHLYNQNELFFSLKLALIIAIIFVGVFLTLLDFFHLLPKAWAFAVSSRLPINFLAIAAIIFTYTDIKLDIITISASFIFLALIASLMKLVKVLSPKSKIPEPSD